ncbi:MAG: non-ribosomal peptide synthetase, partial [Lysobacter sp.]
MARITSTELDALQQRYDIARLYPATAMQHGLLFHTLVDAQAYTSQIALSFDGLLQPTLMRQAWEAVAHRHDVLRTAIVGSDEQPHQLVARRIELPWNEIDLRHLQAHAQEDEFARQRLAQRHQGFDLETPPLMRLSLFRLDDARYRLLWSHHHMLLDGWSLPMVYRDVMEHYEALLAHRQPQVEGFRPYEEYVAWLQRRNMAAARDYWRDYLREVESPTPLSIDKLPADAVRQHRFTELTLSIEATAQLQELARRSHTTLYTVLQYAWGWLLHKYSGESTVVFGAILSGRPAELVDVERMVGLFINTLPVKVVVDMSQRIDEALGELHRAFQQSAEFGYLPLADIRRQTGLPTGAALFDSLLVLENYPLDEAIGAEPRASLALSGVDAFDETDYKLTLNTSLSDRLSIRCSYHTDTFGDRVIERLLGHLESILTQLPMHELPARIELLAPPERQALEQWRTAEQSDGQLCIHRRFEQRVRSTPDAIALVCEDETLSYAELNRQANRLAHALRAKGVQAETLVGLCVERGVQMMVGILGILKAGGAYVPFDPATPRARLAYLLEDSAIGIVVSEAAALEVLPDTLAERVLLDDPSLARHSGDDLAITAVDAGPTSAAYVIYTSGSTGKPKGVLVEHGHVDRLFTVTDRHFGFSDRDVWTLFHSYAFDFSVWEMWGALFYGGKLVIVPKLVARSPELFYQLVAQSGVTVLNQTPAAFEQFARVDEQDNAPLSVRCVIFGGAALDYYTLQPWMERHPALPRMINMYGITETTVHVTFREVTRADVAHGRGSMIGWPLADLTAVVLDAQGRQLPIGVAGELYVGGAGVSRGYLDRPELTAERFIANPDVAGARLYRTGDLVRRHESGELEYLGRIDNQVKIRGFRIELGEIESELNRVELVRESLVLAQGEAADKRLIAYVVANETVRAGADARECSDRIRAALSQVLPDYMVPAVIMVIAAFPLNINGKVDRAALPPPDAGVSA